MIEVAKNGYGTDPLGAVIANPCPSPISNREVAVCEVASKPTDLRVTVTEPLDLVLLTVVGITTVDVSATSTAEYLPPIQMGSRQSYFGDQGECVTGPDIDLCPPDSSGTHVQYFFAAMNGPGDLKEFGDAYVYCEEGPSPAPPADNAATTVNGTGTNHEQLSGGARFAVPSTIIPP